MVSTASSTKISMKSWLVVYDNNLRINNKFELIEISPVHMEKKSIHEQATL